MDAWWPVSLITLWLIALFMGFLLLGALRSLALLRWRLDQLDATTPFRIRSPPSRVDNWTLARPTEVARREEPMDATRARRTPDQARREWYARHCQWRFARFMGIVVIAQCHGPVKKSGTGARDLLPGGGVV